MTPAEIKQAQELIAKLQAENAALKSKGSTGPSCKVTDKGGVSFYGIGRFPVTLYREQWVKLLAHAEMIETFLKDNEAKLSVKPTKTLKVVA